MSNENYGWTAQSQQGWVEDHGVPGNVFTEDQLPHPELQRLAGINPEQYRQAYGLWVDEAAGPRPEFKGTETGHAPHEILKDAGVVQSFHSYVPEVVEDEKPKRSAKK